VAEETAAEGKTLRMTTGDTNKEARVEETQRRDGHAHDGDTEEGEKTGGGRWLARSIVASRVRKHMGTRTRRRRGQIGEGGGEMMANEEKEEDDEDKRHVEANTEEPTPRGEEDETQDE